MSSNKSEEFSRITVNWNYNKPRLLVLENLAQTLEVQMKVTVIVNFVKLRNWTVNTHSFITVLSLHWAVNCSCKLAIYHQLFDIFHKWSSILVVEQVVAPYNLKTLSRRLFDDCCFRKFFEDLIWFKIWEKWFDLIWQKKIFDLKFKWLIESSKIIDWDLKTKFDLWFAQLWLVTWHADQ